MRTTCWCCLTTCRLRYRPIGSGCATDACRRRHRARLHRRSVDTSAVMQAPRACPIFARFLRASLRGELKADYVRTACAKGLRERDVVGRHVMRNALLPFVTIVGLTMAHFIGGTVVAEQVFTYPGLGRLLIQAISTRDYPLIQGCILFILIIFVVINLLVDVLYAYIDPRIDYG